MARLVRAATDRNPPTLGGGGCQRHRQQGGVSMSIMTAATIFVVVLTIGGVVYALYGK